MVVLKNKLLFLCFITLVSNAAQAQLRSEPRNTIDTTYLIPQILQYQNSFQLKRGNQIGSEKSPFENWGFICKWEHQNDEKLKIPVRFRLGTLDYVNKLEGKQ